MRVAIYIRTVATARGTERVTANLAKGFAQRGHTVDFLVEDDKGWIIEDLERQGPNLRVVRLRSSRAMLAANVICLAVSFLKNLVAAAVMRLKGQDACLWPLLRVLRRERPPLLPLQVYITGCRPDAVLSFLNYPNLSLLLTVHLFGRSSPTVVNVRNHISTAARNAESIWMRSVPRFMKRFFPLADLVVANARSVSDDVAQITNLQGERLVTIYNPVFRPEIQEMAAVAPEHVWFEDGQVPVILGAGKLQPQKDFDTLVRAFGIVRNQRPARLVIMGDGPLREALLARARSLGVEDDVGLPGHVRNPYALYGRAAAFVLSSAWEGLPNVVIEALACGCPVVSTNCPGGASEILDDGRYGRLVDVGDEQSMAQAILSVLADPPARSQSIERAALYSLDRTIRAYEESLAAISTHRHLPTRAT